MSRRILSYTADEIFYECSEGTHCESKPHLQIGDKEPSLLSRLPRNTNHRALYQYWQSMVERYSGRQLTVLSDKLPAIAGVATKIRGATKSSYLAGLWQDNLTSYLLLQRSMLEQHDVGLTQYRTPTFSWASIETTIECSEGWGSSLRVGITIIEAACMATDLNPLGEVTDGFVVLEGVLVEGTLNTEQTAEGKYSLEFPQLMPIAGKDKVESRFLPDLLLVEDSMATETGVQQRIVRRARPGDTIASIIDAPIKLLVVKRSEEPWLSVIEGIVLRPSLRVTGAFDRLGYFSLYWGKKDRPFWRSWDRSRTHLV